MVRYESRSLSLYLRTFEAPAEHEMRHLKHLGVSLMAFLRALPDDIDRLAIFYVIDADFKTAGPSKETRQASAIRTVWWIFR